MAEGVTYKDAGVDNDAKKAVSKILFDASRQTWQNRKGRIGEIIVPFDDFSGLRYIDISMLPEGSVMGGGMDGIGTKVEFAERMENHRTMAYNLVAMVAEDAEVRGAEPVLILSILDTNSLKGKVEEAKQLAEGYVNAAREANVAVLSGESAELGNRVSGFGNFNYNWGATCIWFARKDRLFTGKEIKPGDSLVGLQEEGFRSNGISLVRKIMETVYGQRWHDIIWKNGKPLGEMALTPSRIYTRAIMAMTGGYDREPKAEIHGVAHITGGGIPEKLGRVLKPSGLGAVIDKPFSPPEFMLFVQAYGNVKDREAYRTWNMGQGMIVISPEPDKVMEVASEHRIKSQIIGYVIRKLGISIANRGAFNPKTNVGMEEVLYKKGPEELKFD